MKETNYQKFKNIKIREANEKIDSKEPKIKWTDANGMKLDDAYIAVQQVTHEIAKGMAKKRETSNISPFMDSVVYENIKPYTVENFLKDVAQKHCPDEEETKKTFVKDFNTYETLMTLTKNFDSGKGNRGMAMHILPTVTEEISKIARAIADYETVMTGKLVTFDDVVSKLAAKERQMEKDYEKLIEEEQSE